MKKTVTKTETYLDRMRGSRQFSYFGLQPQWIPGTGDIDGFVHDEVVRQFHDPRVKDDGGDRMEWMLEAWHYAMSLSEITIDDIKKIAHLVEPKVNDGVRFRQYNVQIGSYLPPKWEEVPTVVGNLWRTIGLVKPKQGQTDFYKAQGYGHSDHPTADDFYLEYEGIHPWGDGNGRSGKVLHNFLLGTLDDPILVDDYFGGGNP
jgi:hypothetical protein